MFFDLQFSQAKFLQLLTDQIQRALPLVTEEFDNPLGGSDKLMIDHLDVTGIEVDSSPATTVTVAGPSGPTNIAGKVARLKVDIGASLTTRAKVIAAGHLGLPALQSFGIWVKVDVSAKADGGSLVLSVTPIELGSVIDVLSSQTKQQLLSKIPSLDRPITLPDVAGHAMSVTNAGLALGGHVVAILAELTPPGSGTVQAWKDFFAGSFTARSGDWSIILPKDLIVDVVDDAITEAVDSFPSKDPSIEIVEEPSTSWWITGPISKATINAVDACPVGGSDIEVDLNFTVTFALAGSDLQVTIEVLWDLNDWDVFRCAAATVLLPGAAITVIVGAITGPIGAIIAAIVTIIAFIVAVVKISDTAHGQLSDGISGLDPGDMGLKTIAQDDDHAVIQGHVALSNMLAGMTPTMILATPTGLLLAGTLAVPAHHERTLKLVGQSAFGWNAGYSCSKFQWQSEPVDAKLVMQDPANYPVLAKVDVLTVPPSDYTPSLTIWGGTMGGFSLSVHSSLPGGTGPDCKLLIQSNSGARFANLGHLSASPTEPSPEQLILDKVNCYKQKLPGPKQWLEAHWLIDPPPDAEVIQQLNVWEAVLSRVAAGTPIELAVVDRREQARIVTTTPADAKGLASFRVATVAGQWIALSAAAGIGGASLFVAGARLEIVSRLVPRNRAVDATIVGIGNNARVVVATGGQVLTLSLGGALLGSVSVPGVERVASVGDRIAAFDGSRLLMLHSVDGTHLMVISTWHPPQPITQMRVHSGQVFATLLDGTTRVLDRQLTLVAPPNRRRPTKWLAERWLAAPIRVGNYAARVEVGTVSVYRYAQMSVF